MRTDGKSELEMCRSRLRGTEATHLRRMLTIVKTVLINVISKLCCEADYKMLPPHDT